MSTEGPSERKSIPELRIERRRFSKDMERAASQMGQDFSTDEATKVSAMIEERVRESIQEKGLKISKDDLDSVISCKRVDDGWIIYTLHQDYFVDKHDDVHVRDRGSDEFTLLPPEESIDVIARFHPQQLAEIYSKIFKEISEA